MMPKTNPFKEREEKPFPQVLHRKKGNFKFVVLVEEDPTGRIISKAKLTACQDYDFLRSRKGQVLGTAVCNPEDKYNASFGAELAVQRAVKHLYAVAKPVIEKWNRQNLCEIFEGTQYAQPVIRADK